MRKRLLIGLAILGVLVISISGVWLAPEATIGRVKAGVAPPRGSGTITAPFARVIDGDTIEANIDDRRVGVGLIGINAPQGNTQCGQEAIGMMWGLVGGGIRAEEELGFTFDNRKRRMYYVYTADGASVALEMVKAGLARPDGNWREAPQLLMAELLARKNHVGCLWRDPNAPPPMPPPPEEGEEEAPAEPAAPSTTLPPGFTLDVLVSEMSDPTAFVFLPDGRILIAEKSGLVKVLSNGGILPTPFINIQSQVNAW